MIQFMKSPVAVFVDMYFSSVLQRNGLLVCTDKYIRMPEPLILAVFESQMNTIIKMLQNQFLAFFMCNSAINFYIFTLIFLEICNIVGCCLFISEPMCHCRKGKEYYISAFT